MSVNIQLVEEILKNEGELQALYYLRIYEKLPIEEAQQILLSITNGLEIMYQENPTDFPHYCMFCDDSWIGSEASLCPICNTDGVDRT